MSTNTTEAIFNQEYDIGFVVAMKEELQSLIIQDPEVRNPEHFEEILDKAVKIGNARFIPFKMPTTVAPGEQHEVTLNCLACLSGIGKVNAGSATTILLTHFKVETLINIGLCGAGNSNDRIGKVYLVEHSIYGDVNAQVFGYNYGQVPGSTITFYPTAIKFVNNLYNQLNQFHSISKSLIITNDSFISNKNYKDNLIKLISETAVSENIEINSIGLDMECAAIMQVANNFGKKVIAIKEVSDSADDNATNSFKNTAYNQNSALQESIKFLGDALPFINKALEVKRYRARNSG